MVNWFSVRSISDLSRVYTFICQTEFCGHCVARNANILQLMYENWD